MVKGSQPTDMKLYNKVKKEADEKFEKHGAYKAMCVVREYKKRGGKYEGKRSDSTMTWRSQKWIDMEEYLKGKRKACGAKKDTKAKACRPITKEGSNLLTAKEVVNMHGKDGVRKIIQAKKDKPSARIGWKKGTVGGKKVV